MLHDGGYQPYTRQGGREPGDALQAMLRGRGQWAYNPQDIWRRTQTQGGIATLLQGLAQGNKVDLSPHPPKLTRHRG